MSKPLSLEFARVRDMCAQIQALKAPVCAGFRGFHPDQGRWTISLRGDDARDDGAGVVTLGEDLARAVAVHLAGSDAVADRKVAKIIEIQLDSLGSLKDQDWTALPSASSAETGRARVRSGMRLVK
ncbi:hypothetical protein [Micavibrio aeruginosavorus]|uniref:Uncharacterized protein n=1 Tax=Micavibrio aeruginosavorus EPB TaxID=349215 RepID=M4VHJ4_9BACT|nr:hypothetical protein [Micavibrio aeruginosavorus]AGH98872.1 hypothetical protein A11S_2072 [Micavibrio aeruginosavorus EPB]